MSRVIVAGSIITDMSVQVDNHPKVGETVIGSNLEYSPGGKGANQAVSAARLGAETYMIGAVGDDTFGNMSLEFLQRQDINTKNIITSSLPTGIAMIQVSKETGNNSIAVILGANEELREDDVDNFTYRKGDVLVSQFEIPLNVVKRFFHKGKHAKCVNILNPAPAADIPNDILEMVDVLIVNETELETISKFKINEKSLIDDVITAMNRIDGSMKKDSIIITTLGDKGVIAMRNRYVIAINPIKVDAIDTTGAGDCFVGAFASFVSKNKISRDNLEEALIFANKAASLSVQKKGSGISCPYLLDLK